MPRNHSTSDRSSDRSDKSGQSDSPDPTPPTALRPHGGYRRLRSFQVAQLVYDCTRIFCDRFLERGSRTHDQMIQAARSGVQNIAEGSAVSGTSRKTELKLTGVARASLEELLLDYEDFLRHRRLTRWEKDSVAARAVRDHRGPATAEGHGLPTASPEAAANSVICLIHQASYLLRRQLAALDQQFLHEGGFTERLYRVRTEQRRKTSDRSDQSDSSDKSDRSDKTSGAPPCPSCGRRMLRRTARRGPHSGRQFWGCPAYPDCVAILPL